METVNLNENSGLLAAIRYFSDPMVCLDAVSKAKWPNGPQCPRCDGKKLSFVKTRLTWTCLGCRKQFSVKVGTIFEDSPMGLDKWLTAMWMIANCKNGISSYEIARALEITQKSAWFMLHRIRHAMQRGTINAPLSGEVEADETFVGGKLRLMNRKAKARKILREGRLAGGGMEGKAIVMGLLERHGEARVRVVHTRRRHDVVGMIQENVAPGSTMYTDQLQSYRGLMADYAHEVIDHTEAYVKGRIHTNGMENFWSLFKRTLKGTYVSVEPYHLQAYADEQCFRFNERKGTDRRRFSHVLDTVAGRRLDWKTLTGKEVG